MKTHVSSRPHPAFSPEILEARIAPATLYALTSSNDLLSFDSAAPTTILETIPVTGLIGAAGETLVGMDFRPATGELYLFSVDAANDGRLYVLNEYTGAAAFVGTITNPDPINTLSYGFDFNPTVDRIRVVNSAGENLRLNPNTGILAGDDTNLTFGMGTTGPVSAVAYDRSIAGTAFSTLYGIDTGSDALIRIGGTNGNPSPNAGAVSLVGSLGVDATSADFDIEIGAGTAFATLTVGGTVGLYTIDLTTGAATSVGAIGNGATALVGFAVAPPTVKIVNAKTATYLDADGDKVTIKVSKGSLEPGDFRLIGAANGGGTLRLINLSDDGIEFDGANVTITAAKKAGGDGEAHVGYINATGVDLGKIVVKGDLSRIDAGDSNPDKPGAKSLQVNSFGRLGTITQGVAEPVMAIFQNGLGAAVIKGDLAGSLQSMGGVDGKIGSVKVGGSIVGGQTDFQGAIVAFGDIGSIQVRENVIGGGATRTGAVVSLGSIGKVSIGGDLIGGAGGFSGSIDAAGSLGDVKVGGSVFGGSAQETGRIKAGTEMRSLSIGESLLGGSGNASGFVSAGGAVASILIKGSVIGSSGPQSGELFIDGRVTKALIGQSVHGGSGPVSGNIQLRGGVGTITVGGSVVGGTTDDTGALFFPLGADNVVVKKDLVGGSIAGATSLVSSGKIEGQRIGKLTINGSVIAGVDASTGTLAKSGGIFVQEDLGTLVVKGDLVGNPTNRVIIVAKGQATPTAGVDLAVGSIKVGGEIRYTRVLAGYDTDDFGATTTDPSGFEPVNGNAQVGTITVGRNWLASSVAAGIRDLDGDGFGGSDDQVINALFDATISRIAAVTIKGQVIGTAAPGDEFGFVAQDIGAMKIGGRKIAFDGTEGQVFPLSSLTGDAIAREVIII
jgi:hypothetical protein